jgi:outer membrane protein assembly factor BamA
LEPLLDKYFFIKVVITLYCTAAFFSISATAQEDIINHNDSGVTSQTLIIDDITCIGNETTQCSFIKKKYYQEIGDELDPDEIIDAKLRLGTLIQFKNIDVYLQKGHQRGHIVVVFEIKEASNLQYEIVYQHQYTKRNETFFSCDDESKPKYNQGRIDLCDRNTYKVAEVQNLLYANIKNFNFLGSGKELTLEIVHSKTDNETDHFLQPLAEPENTDNWSSRNIKRSKYVNIQYYDPHFFDSPYYYFHAYLDVSKFTHESYTADLNGIHIEPKPTVNGSNTWFSFGRRFGRYSYFSVNMSGSLTEKINKSFRINYGFNSENDVLLPTSGSKFLLSNSIFDNANRYAISYIKHFSLPNQRAFSLGGKGSYYKQSTEDGYAKSTDLSLTAKYSSIRAINKKQGEYAGWYIGIEAFNRQNIYDDNPKERHHIAEINAGYIYQTENMVYRFTLEVSLNESK